MSDQDDAARTAQKLSLTIEQHESLDGDNISNNSPTDSIKSPKRGKTPPPPPKPAKKSAPKPPPKATALLKQIKSESKRRLLETQNEFAQTIHFPQNDDENEELDNDDNDLDEDEKDHNIDSQLPKPLKEGNEDEDQDEDQDGDNDDDENESESIHLSDIENEEIYERELEELENKVKTPKLKKSKTAMQFSRNVSIKKRRSAANIKETDPSKPRSRQGRVHSKSLSSSPNTDNLRKQWQKEFEKKRISATALHKKTPPPPPRPPISTSLSSTNQLSPYRIIDKDIVRNDHFNANNDGLLPDLNLNDDTQSLSGNEDDEKSQINKNRPNHWRRSATVDLTNKKPRTESKRSTRFQRKRKKKPPPSHTHGTKSPPPPARPKRDQTKTDSSDTNHTRKRSSTTAIITSILENEQIATGSDKSTSTSHELLSSATELIDEANIINDTQDAYKRHITRKLHKKSLSSANMQDMNRSEDEDEDEDEFISDDGGLMPAPMFHRQSFHSVAPLSHSKSVSHQSPPSPATAVHSQINSVRSTSVYSGARKNRKQPIPKNYVQVAQLMKNDNRLSLFIRIIIMRK